MTAEVIAWPTEAAGRDTLEEHVTVIPRLLSLETTAELLGKTAKQLRWMVYRDTAPRSALIGGRRMFRAADVARFIDEAFEATGEVRS